MILEQFTKEVIQLETLGLNGNYEQAETQARELLNNPIVEIEHELLSRILIVLSASLWQRGFAKEALPNALAALTKAENCSNKELIVKALGNVGSIFQNLSNYLKALEYQQRALELSIELGSNINIAKNVGNIGIVYYCLSDYPKALEYYQWALNLSDELGDRFLSARNTSNIGLVYIDLSDYKKALEYLHTAMAISEELGDKIAVARNTSNIGIVYSDLSDYSKALEYLHKAKNLYHELGDNNGVATNASIIGNVYIKFKDYSQALEFLFLALTLSEGLNDKRGIARDTGNIGTAYYYLLNYEKALEYMYQSLKITEKLGNKRTLAFNTGNIGKVYADEKYEKHNFSIAENYLLKAIKMCEELNVKRGQSLFEKSLSDLYKKQNRWEECQLHFEKFYELEKELQIAESKKQADQLDYERQEAEREKQRAVARAKHEATEQLLHNVLPPDIAHRILNGVTLIAEKLPKVSVLFADIVGFTRISQQITPEQLVEGLDRIFTKFDALAEKHGLEKIKTIGDCYMVVAGAPKVREDHAKAIAYFALEMQEAIKKFKAITTGEQIQMRIGIHAGEVVAGVIGKKKFAYDLWGDTVNTASRMESHGEAGKIHVSADFVELLKETAFQFTERGQMEVKGKGVMTTYFLEKQLKNQL